MVYCGAAQAELVDGRHWAEASTPTWCCCLLHGHPSWQNVPSPAHPMPLSISQHSRHRRSHCSYLSSCVVLFPLPSFTCAVPMRLQLIVRCADAGPLTTFSEAVDLAARCIDDGHFRPPCRIVPSAAVVLGEGRSCSGMRAWGAGSLTSRRGFTEQLSRRSLCKQRRPGP